MWAVSGSTNLGTAGRACIVASLHFLALTPSHPHSGEPESSRIELLSRVSGGAERGDTRVPVRPPSCVLHAWKCPWRCVPPALHIEC